MTFLERYEKEGTWQGRATIMEIYHLAMCQNYKSWTIGRTAEHFGVSIGLVSENLRLANALHLDMKFLSCDTRQEALRQLSKRNGF